MRVILPPSSWKHSNFNKGLLRKPFFIVEKATHLLVIRYVIAKFSKLKRN